MASNQMGMICVLRVPASDEEEHDEDEDLDDGIWPVELKSSIWSRIPSELVLERILPRLPFATVVRLRSVSCSWNVHLSSLAFWMDWIRINPSPCFLVCSTSPPPSHDASGTRWMKSKSISFVRPEGSQTSSPQCSLPSSLWLTFRPPLQESYDIVASDGGLLLLRDRQHRQFMVCNPLINSYKQLPKCGSDEENDFLCFVSDIASESYTVLLSTFSRLEVYLYFSTSGSWKLMLAKHNCKDPGTSLCMTAFHDSKLLCCYHAEDELVSWEEFSVSSLISTCKFTVRSLIWKESDHFLTVALMDGEMKICQLFGHVWRAVASLPSHINIVFAQSSSFECTKLGNALCLSAKKDDRVFIYDIDVRQGYWTSSCPFSKQFFQICGYQPSTKVA